MDFESSKAAAAQEIAALLAQFSGGRAKPLYNGNAGEIQHPHDFEVMVPSYQPKPDFAAAGVPVLSYSENGTDAQGRAVHVYNIGRMDEEALSKLREAVQKAPERFWVRETQALPKDGWLEALERFSGGTAKRLNSAPEHPHKFEVVVAANRTQPNFSRAGIKPVSILQVNLDGKEVIMYNFGALDYKAIQRLRDASHQPAAQRTFYPEGAPSAADRLVTAAGTDTGLGVPRR